MWYKACKNSLCTAVVIKNITSLIAPWWGVKVPGGHRTSCSTPAGQYLPRAQGNPGPAEPARATDFRRRLEQWAESKIILLNQSSYSSRLFLNTPVLRVLRLACRTEPSFFTSLTGCPTCLTQLFPCCTSRARWPVRTSGALFTEKPLWAQEVGGGSLWAAFQTVKTLRKVFIDY